MKTVATKLTLVLMAGLPGAGKTTLAYALSQMFGWQVVDKDLYKDVLIKQGMDGKESSRVAYEISFAMLRAALLHHSASVIFDTAALGPFIMEEVTEIMSVNRDVRLKVILCIADCNLRHYRICTRPSQRTPVSMEATIPNDYLYHFRHLPGEKLILDTSADLEVCLSKAKAYIIGT